MNPKEKAEKAYEEQQMMMRLNRKLRVRGVSIHNPTTEDFQLELDELRKALGQMVEAREESIRSMYWEMNKEYLADKAIKEDSAIKAAKKALE